MPVKQLEGTPFIVCIDEGRAPLPDSDDMIILSAWKDPDGWWLALPQFDLEACEPELSPASIENAIKRLLAFYDALSELPDEYINFVERQQMDIIERVLIPWFSRLMARNPAYWSTPSEAFKPDLMDGAVAC